MREFLDPTNRQLNLHSQELTVAELLSPEIKSITDDMRRITSGERDEAHPNRRSLVGLSAPQLGELVRIILIDVAADPTIPNFTPNLKFFINPRIIKASSEETLSREGCYSTGEICGAVMRANDVTVYALDETGEEFIHQSGNKFQSCILQHEIDHLDGIRFPSRIRDPKHLHQVGTDEFQDYRENWATWKKYYPFAKWLEMYQGS